MWLFLMECLAPHAAKDGHQQFVTRERSPEMGFDVRLSISGGGGRRHRDHVIADEWMTVSIHSIHTPAIR